MIISCVIHLGVRLCQPHMAGPSVLVNIMWQLQQFLRALTLAGSSACMTTGKTGLCW